VALLAKEGLHAKLHASGDHSAVVPPVPIPNTEVKRCSPNDSASLGGAKVGRRQSYRPAPQKGAGRLCFPSLLNCTPPRGEMFTPHLQNLRPSTQVELTQEVRRSGGN
jgi:hypothetical protein